MSTLPIKLGEATHKECLHWKLIPEVRPGPFGGKPRAVLDETGGMKTKASDPTERPKSLQASCAKPVMLFAIKKINSEKVGCQNGGIIRLVLFNNPLGYPNRAQKETGLFFL